MTNDNSATIVSKVWNYAHVLKNAGVGYCDYVEQITYLLFLKLADEMTELGFDNPIPQKFAWSELSSKVAEASRLSSWTQDQRRDASATIANQIHYRHTLENLGTPLTKRTQKPILSRS